MRRRRTTWRWLLVAVPVGVLLWGAGERWPWWVDAVLLLGVAAGGLAQGWGSTPDVGGRLRRDATRLRGWARTSGVLAGAYAALAAAIGLTVALSGDATDDALLALCAVLVASAVWIAVRSPFVGVWVRPDAVVVGGWLGTRVVRRGGAHEVHAVRYDGALVRGRSAWLWHLVVRDLGPGGDKLAMRITVARQATALGRARELAAVLAEPDPAADRSVDARRA